jgi:hypothetical protein
MANRRIPTYQQQRRTLNNQPRAKKESADVSRRSVRRSPEVTRVVNAANADYAPVARHATLRSGKGLPLFKVVLSLLCCRY